MTKEILRKIEEIEKKAGKSWLTIAQKAKTEGDLIKIASEYGVSLTKDQAAEGLKLLTEHSQKLTETDLSEIAGGGIVFK
ncbi:MAG: hypothetical protein GXY29_08960 [Thermotogaceae bacterium]|jgi:hypothetical protein|nr:hypothetical protein [Thermotogota bacterium]NLZ14303.1 hypothetical protein [Thermotogaceae bacterium]MDD8041087.1 hypothetical protein [Thermotogota bacterium]MDD8053283.1 hypothetical protein [Thermotogota bacterium]HPB87919.1 hypothetical protein [Thermotogota bacterium]